MKKLLTVSLYVGLLLLTACKVDTNISPSTPDPSTENSSITENEISLKADETPIQDLVESYQESIEENEPIYILTLTIPLEIIRQCDNPLVYDTGKQEELLGTQNQIERYSKWISTLQGAGITAIYGETVPTFEYIQGKMSLEDSQIIFDKIKSITQYLKPMRVEKNKRFPYAGADNQAINCQG